MSDMERGGAIITGAGPGVSGSLARLLATEGHAIGLLGVDRGTVEAVADEIRTAGGVAHVALADLTDAVSARAAVGDLGARVGPVDVVHFNPSAFREKDPFELEPHELLEDVLLGVGSLLTVVQAARPFLREGSRITVTGSMAADRPWHRAASLGVQKASVRNLVRSIDATLEDDGIRAVSVTVRGTLADDGPFTPARVAAAIHAAISQGGASGDDWRTEVRYEG